MIYSVRCPFFRSFLVQNGDSYERSKLSETSFEFDKFCVTGLNLHPIHETDDGFAIYVIDASSLHPSLDFILEARTEDFPDACLAVLGTKLYLFGGVDWSKSRHKLDNGIVSTYPYCYWINNAYFYDMRDEILSRSSPPQTTTLNKSMLHEISPMKGRKARPNAVVIDDYRICVFGSHLFYRSPTFYDEPRYEAPSFELLDTRDDSWTQLPELFEYESMCLKEVYFTHSITVFSTKRSTLMVYTTMGIFYRMNFDVENPSWEELKYQIPRSHKFDDSLFPVRTVMIGDSVLGTPYEMLRIDTCSDEYRMSFGSLKQKGLSEWDTTGASFVDGKYVYIAQCGKKLDSEDYELVVEILNFPSPTNFFKICCSRFSLHGKKIYVQGFFPIKGC